MPTLAALPPAPNNPLPPSLTLFSSTTWNSQALQAVLVCVSLRVPLHMMLFP